MKQTLRHMIVGEYQTANVTGDAAILCEVIRIIDDVKDIKYLLDNNQVLFDDDLEIILGIEELCQEVYCHATPNRLHWHPLHIAIIEGRSEVTSVVLTKFPSAVEIRDTFSRLPLHLFLAYQLKEVNCCNINRGNRATTSTDYKVTLDSDARDELSLADACLVEQLISKYPLALEEHLRAPTVQAFANGRLVAPEGTRRFESLNNLLPVHLACLCCNDNINIVYNVLRANPSALLVHFPHTVYN
uniref:Uncharacterized protein n=1 Tax=Chaetoceros debilis TaxID=122233 RepID=A0A7S3Q5T7_9STRA